jgi:histidinol dehydrogenase
MQLRLVSLKIITGIDKAKSSLSRKAVVDFGKVSPRVKDKLKLVFGKSISAERAVSQIIKDIRKKGDQAIFDYTFRIDGFRLESLEIDRQQIQLAYTETNPELVTALRVASERIQEFHEEQRDSIFHGVNGPEWGQLVRPLERVGVYAPGGTANYPSTVLMTAIPARVAGVKEIVLATPPRINGRIPPATLVAADIAGVNKVFCVGGAQAIAALAYGTESIPAVDKICGPGNIFVALAKKAVYGAVAIDGFMGPSEVLVIADESANIQYCAADLLAQAEHDTLSQVILVTNSNSLAKNIQKEIEVQLIDLPRKHIAAEALEKQGMIVVVDSLDDAIELANLYAPEHLELLINDAESYLTKITNAGCIFTGHYSTVPMGDYVIGPNHSLPTGGTARFSSPLNIVDFVKFIDVVKVSPSTLKTLGNTAMTLARAENLEAHSRAIEKRLIDLT